MPATFPYGGICPRGGALAAPLSVNFNMWQNDHVGAINNPDSASKSIVAQKPLSSASSRAKVVKISYIMARGRAFSPGDDKSLRNLGDIIYSYSGFPSFDSIDLLSSHRCVADSNRHCR